MLRTASGLSVVAILLAAAGCTMCCHPYDYCGPVYDSPGCQSCGSHSRAGSILAGEPELTESPEMVERSVPNKSMASISSREPVQRQSASYGQRERQVQGQPRFGDVPGSEKIVSVTDRVVGSDQPAADQPQIAADPSAEPSVKPFVLPAATKGWTARRPTPEIQR